MSENRKQEIAHAAAKILLDTKSVLFNAKEPFKYTSGNTGPVYVDCRRLISFTQARATLMDYAVELLNTSIGANALDYIAGGETAGIPYAAFIAERMDKPMLYVRKKPKGFGRMAQIEGHFHEDIQSKNVILIEDVQNFGSSKPIFINALRNAGATIEHFFTVFDYGIRPKIKDINNEISITDHNLSNWWAVLDVAREDGYFDEETLSSVEAFLNKPDEWTEKHTA